jgi:hypothetical protein
MDARFAFTAQSWGDGAVVCRAVEDRPGPVVEQQFGEFLTWTQAHAFASKLNEGLGLDILEVRQIVTSSLLATACVIQEALNSRLERPASPAVAESRATQHRFILAELNLALTFCRSARALSSGPLQLALLNARNAIEHSMNFLRRFRGVDSQLAELASRIQELDASLQGLLSSVPRLLEQRSSQFWPDELQRHPALLLSDSRSRTSQSAF